MTTTYKPGDPVRLIGKTVLTRLQGLTGTVVDPSSRPGLPATTVLVYIPEHESWLPDKAWAFQPESLEYAFRPGDIVTPTNSEWADYTVVRLTNRGNVVIRDEEGYIQKEAPGDLHLTYRPLNDAEITAQCKQQYDRPLKLTEQEKGNRIAAQYANDQALLAAGLVRVDLLRQWSPTFTERTREPQYALLQRLRSVLAAPNENKEQA